jgi:ABC-type Fe3+-hydroxamate transport system substrate-binding protein
MRTKKIVSIVLVTVLLASAVSLAITPATADIYYEIPGDINPHDDKLTKEELVNMILPYMLDEGTFALDDVGDAVYVYAYWGGEPKTVITTSSSGDFQVTFYRPLERIATTFTMNNRMAVALGLCDRLVGVMYTCLLPEEENACGGKILEIPNADYRNTEVTACLRPDIVFGHIPGNPEDYQKKVNAPVAYGGPMVSTIEEEAHREMIYIDIKFAGELFDMEEEAEELNSFIKEKYDKVLDVVSEIPDEEKPKACLVKGKGKVTSARSAFCSPFDEAGGISIKKDLGVSEISVEKLVEWNPDVIFITNSGSSYRVEGGYRETPLSLTVEQVLADSQLQTVNAVKTGSVYYTTGCCCWVPHQRVITSTMYMAKIFYPDKLKDIDLEKDGNEVFERFYSVDGLYTEYADNMGYFREFIDNPPEEGKWQNVPE